MELKLANFNSENLIANEIQEIKEKIKMLRKYSISMESSILLQLYDIELSNKIEDFIGCNSIN